MVKSESELIKCLIVDDEAMAHEVIKSHLAQIDRAKLIGQCYTGSEAYNFIQNETIDVMFLDIKMPELTGLELLKSLNKHPKVILTTAYSEFALESYDLEVVDYLLKPIEFARFLKAFNKIVTNDSSKSNTVKPLLFIDIKIQGIPHRVFFSHLEYVEALGNYLKLHLSDKLLFFQGTMHSWEKENLPKDIFCRVHKSFIVNLTLVTEISHNVLKLCSGKKIPIGRQYKALIQDRLLLLKGKI
jgi:two-component system LytT family response regulator